MAAAIARHIFLLNSTDIYVHSAGTNAAENAPITPKAEQALGDLKIISSHQSTRLSADHLRAADVAYGMETKHIVAMEKLAQSLPIDIRPCILLLDDPNEVQDPLGKGLLEYQALSRQLNKLIPLQITKYEKQFGT